MAEWLPSRPDRFSPGTESSYRLNKRQSVWSGLEKKRIACMCRDLNPRLFSYSWSLFNLSSRLKLAECFKHNLQWTITSPIRSSHFLRKTLFLTQLKQTLWTDTLLYCIVLYCGRVPAANASELLYKPWTLVVHSCIARCLHQRP